MLSTGTQSCLRSEYLSYNLVLLCSSVIPNERSVHVFANVIKNKITSSKTI